MTDPSGLSDEELKQAAGLEPTTPSPSMEGVQSLSDEELHRAAGTNPGEIIAPLPKTDFWGDIWRAPSGEIMRAPSFMDAVSAQIPFASDVAGLGRGLIKGAGNLIEGKDVDFGKNYEAGRKDFWAANEAYKQEHPLLDKGAQVLGTVLGMGTAPAAAAPVAGGNLLAQSLRSGAVAAPIGAAYGFGTSSGDLPERLRNAEVGGLTGGALGLAAPAVARGISAGTEKVSNLLGLGDPNARAAALLNRALGRDSLTPADLETSLASAPNKPLTIADVAGAKDSATSRLARTVLDTPGEGSSKGAQFLEERDLGKGINGPNDMFRSGGTADRVIDNVKMALGSDDAFQTAADLLQKRQQDSAPLYDAFRQQPPVPARQVQQFMSSPTFRKAVGRANTSVLDEGGSPLTDLIDFNEAGDPTRVKGGAFPPDTLDRIKQGLDDVWLAAKTSGDAGEARTANTLRTRFLAFMDSKYPDTYASARAAYAGPSASLNALQQGAEVFKTAPQDIGKMLQGMPAEDQDMFRLGVQQALISKVKNTADGANEVRALLGTPAKRESVLAAFGGPDSPELKQLASDLGWENRMFQTRQLAGGSRTAPSLMDQEDASLAGPALHATAHAVGGNPHGAMMQFIPHAWRRLTTGVGENTSAALADMLLNPANNASTLQTLRNLPLDQQRQLMARALGMTPALTTASGVIAGQSQ